MKERKNNKFFNEFRSNGKTVVMRAPQWSDLHDFMNLLNEFHQEALNKALWIPTSELSLEEACDKFCEILKNVELNKTVYVMTEVDSKLAGMAWLNIHKGMFGEGYGTLSIQVSSKYRGLGIGKKLMEIIEKSAIKNKLKGILLTVIDRNPAIQLYEKLGYKEIGRKPNYVGAKHLKKQTFNERADLVEMLKKL